MPNSHQPCLLPSCRNTSSWEPAASHSTKAPFAAANLRLLCCSLTLQLSSLQEQNRQALFLRDLGRDLCPTRVSRGPATALLSGKNGNIFNNDHKGDRGKEKLGVWHKTLSFNQLASGSLSVANPHRPVPSAIIRWPPVLRNSLAPSALTALPMLLLQH